MDLSPIRLHVLCVTLQTVFGPAHQILALTSGVSKALDGHMLGHMCVTLSAT